MEEMCIRDRHVGHLINQPNQFVMGVEVHFSWILISVHILANKAQQPDDDRNIHVLRADRCR